jgi:hypothetical protein
MILYVQRLKDNASKVSGIVNYSSVIEKAYSYCNKLRYNPEAACHIRQLPGNLFL